MEQLNTQRWDAFTDNERKVIDDSLCLYLSDIAGNAWVISQRLRAELAEKDR